MTSRSLILALLAAALAGCSARPTAAADETAIRQTLAELERKINQGDVSFTGVFAKDAVIVAPSAPDVVGFEAIHKMYADMMNQVAMTVHFSTQEIAVTGDLAYERGTYTLRISDKSTGKVLQEARNKHLHILKRQPDGAWKTWRMMVSSAEPAPAP